jgi:hypothetical protein
VRAALPRLHVRAQRRGVVRAGARARWGLHFTRQLLLYLVAGRSYTSQCRSASEIGRLILYGRGYINSTIVTRPRQPPTPFDPHTRTA